MIYVCIKITYVARRDVGNVSSGQSVLLIDRKSSLDWKYRKQFSIFKEESCILKIIENMIPYG